MLQPRIRWSTTVRARERAVRRPKRSRDQHRMVQPSRCEPKRGLKVFWFQVGHLLENLRRGKSGGEEIKDIADADAHTTNAWTPAALLGINGDSFGQRVHDREYSNVCWGPWFAFRFFRPCSAALKRVGVVAVGCGRSRDPDWTFRRQHLPSPLARHRVRARCMTPCSRMKARAFRGLRR